MCLCMHIEREREIDLELPSSSILKGMNSVEYIGLIISCLLCLQDREKQYGGKIHPGVPLGKFGFCHLTAIGDLLFQSASSPSHRKEEKEGKFLTVCYFAQFSFMLHSVLQMLECLPAPFHVFGCSFEVGLVSKSLLILLLKFMELLNFSLSRFCAFLFALTLVSLFHTSFNWRVEKKLVLCLLWSHSWVPGITKTMAAELVNSATSDKLAEMDWVKNIEICEMVAHDQKYIYLLLSTFLVL